ncbi:hypothetical protein ACLK11_11065 [Escherichia coli]
MSDQFDAKSVFKNRNQPARRLSHVRKKWYGYVVGKAKDLKKRLSSYFRSNLASRKTEALVAEIQQIDVTVTRTRNRSAVAGTQLHQTLSAALQRFATR